MNSYWSIPTPNGLCSVRLTDGQWHAKCEGTPLGTYATLRQAIDDLGKGRPLMPIHAQHGTGNAMPSYA